MSTPKTSDEVFYRVGPRFEDERGARILRVVETKDDGVNDVSVVDLLVYGLPSDGPEFAAGPAYKLGVVREQRRHALGCKCKDQKAHQHTKGTWTA